MSNELEDIGKSAVGAAIMTGIAYAIGPAGAPFANMIGGSALTHFAAMTAINYGLNEVGEALAPKAPRYELQRQRTDITTLSPIASHKVIYGRALTGGTLVYSQLSQFDSDYLNMVIAVAPHEIEGIQKVYINSDTALDLSITDDVMSVTAQELYDDNITTTQTYTGTVIDGGQINVDAYWEGLGTLKLVVAGSTVFNHSGGGVTRFETYQNSSGAGQSYTLTFTPSGATNKAIVQLLNCNFQIADKYKDLIHLYPVYGDPSNPDYFEYLGRDVTDQDPYHVATTGEWNGLHQMKGIAHIWARLKFDTTVWQGGAPNIASVVKGAKVYDPRDTTTAWSDNPALIIRDYLTNTQYGCAVSASDEIDDTTFNSAANLCDEVIQFFDSTVDTDQYPLMHGTYTLREDPDATGRTQLIPNGLTTADKETAPFHVGDTVSLWGIPAYNPLRGVDRIVSEIMPDGKGFYLDHTWSASDISDTGVTVAYELNRYSCNGVLDTANSKKENINQLLTTLAGRLLYTNGSFKLLGGEYRSPSGTITEDQLVGGISISTRPPSNALFNCVKGFYTERNTDFVARDYKPYVSDGIGTNPDYINDDNGRTNFIDLPLRFTTNQKQAQELARIALERSRMFQTVRISCNMSAMKYQVGDVVRLTYGRASISSAIYEIIDYNINIGEAVTVDLVLQEFSSDLYPI